MIMETLRKLFVRGYVDKRVDSISRENIRILRETAKSARSHRDLLERNGITLQIHVATQGKHHA